MRVVYCAGEQGRVVLDILRSVGETDDIVFADDDPALHGESVAGRPVVGGLDDIAAREESVASVVAFGDQPGVRLDLADRLADAGCEFFNAVHAAATRYHVITYQSRSTAAVWTLSFSESTTSAGRFTNGSVTARA